MRYRQGVQHLIVCCTPVQITISVTPNLTRHAIYAMLVYSV